jgi:hypothetical protein
MKRTLFVLTWLSAFSPVAWGQGSVDIRPVVESALLHPDTLDANLPSFEEPAQMAACFDQKAVQVHTQEQQQLAACNSMAPNTPDWSACHHRAEAYTLQAEVLANLASSVRGELPFQSSYSGLHLILNKSMMDAGSYENMLETVLDVVRTDESLTCNTP